MSCRTDNTWHINMCAVVSWLVLIKRDQIKQMKTACSWKVTNIDWNKIQRLSSCSVLHNWFPNHCVFLQKRWLRDMKYISIQELMLHKSIHHIWVKIKKRTDAYWCQFLLLLWEYNDGVQWNTYKAFTQQSGEGPDEVSQRLMFLWCCGCL